MTYLTIITTIGIVASCLDERREADASSFLITNYSDTIASAVFDWPARINPTYKMSEASPVATMVSVVAASACTRFREQ